MVPSSRLRAEQTHASGAELHYEPDGLRGRQPHEPRVRRALSFARGDPWRRGKYLGVANQSTVNEIAELAVDGRPHAKLRIGKLADLVVARLGALARSPSLLESRDLR